MEKEVVPKETQIHMLEVTIVYFLNAFFLKCINNLICQKGDKCYPALLLLLLNQPQSNSLVSNIQGMAGMAQVVNIFLWNILQHTDYIVVIPC